MSREVIHMSQSPRCTAAGLDTLGKMDRHLVLHSGGRVRTRPCTAGHCGLDMALELPGLLLKLLSEAVAVFMMNCCGAGD